MRALWYDSPEHNAIEAADNGMTQCAEFLFAWKKEFEEILNTGKLTATDTAAITSRMMITLLQLWSNNPVLRRPPETITYVGHSFYGVNKRMPPDISKLEISTRIQIDKSNQRSSA